MDCCDVNGLDREFTQSAARGDLKSYRKRGLDKRARKVADFLKSQGLSNATVLDIGCGIGALNLELLRAGAARATGVDVSAHYAEAAETLASSLGLRDSVEYRVGDFVQLDPDVPDADITTLDRVVCCYPHMNELVSSSARRTHRLYALTYPRWTWWLRAGNILQNLFYAVLRKRYRGFMHRPEDIGETLSAEGFFPVYEDRSGVWEIAVHQRRPRDAEQAD